MFSTNDKKATFIRNLFGESSSDRRQKDIYVKCPFCVGTKKLKLSIRVSDSLCHCWVCGYSSRTLSPIIRKFFPANVMSEFNEVYPPDEFTKKWLLDNDITDDVVGKSKVILPRDWTPLTSANYESQEVISALIYLTKKRGLSLEDIWRWKIGLSTTGYFYEKVIFPSHDNEGNLNYLVGRSYKNNGIGKYFGSGVPTNEVVFNEYLIDWSQPIKLCEGVFDAVKIAENAIPLLGSSFNSNHLIFDKIVRHGSKVILALDSDAVQKTERYVKLLESYNIDTQVILLESGDPGSRTKIEWKKIESEAKYLSWSERISSKLERIFR